MKYSELNSSKPFLNLVRRSLNFFVKTVFISYPVQLNQQSETASREVCLRW
jgi:hypothetical protein